MKPEDFSPKIEAKAFSRQVIWTIFSLLLIRLNPIIDQISAADISTEHLIAISVLGYILLPSYVIGNSLGRPLLVLVGGRWNQGRAELLGSFVVICGFLSFILCLALVVLRGPLLSLAGLNDTSGIDLAYHLIVVEAGILGINGIVYFSLVAIQKSKELTYADGLQLAITLLGNLAIFHWDTDPIHKFLAIVSLKGISEIVYLVYGIILLRGQVSLSPESVIANFWKSRSLITWDAISLVLKLGYPFLSYLILVKYVPTEALAAFSVGHSLLIVLIVPSMGIAMSGTSELARILHDKHTMIWSNLFQSIVSMTKKTTLMIGALLIVLLVPCLEFLFGLRQTHQLIIASLGVAAFLPLSILAPTEALLRALNQQKLLVATELFANFLVGIPVAVFFLELQWFYAAVAAIFLLPAVVQVFWYRIQRPSFEILRRSTQRYSISRLLGAEVTIYHSNGNHFNYRLMDLSVNGCCLMGDDTFEFQVGQEVKGVLILGGLKPFHFEGRVQNTSDLSPSFLVQSRGKKIGLKFLLAPERDIEEILEKLIGAASVQLAA